MRLRNHRNLYDV